MLPLGAVAVQTRSSTSPSLNVPPSPGGEQKSLRPRLVRTKRVGRDDGKIGGVCVQAIADDFVR